MKERRKLEYLGKTLDDNQQGPLILQVRKALDFILCCAPSQLRILVGFLCLLYFQVKNHDNTFLVYIFFSCASPKTSVLDASRKGTTIKLLIA